MSGTNAAIAVEIVKTTASGVVRSATIFLVAGIVALAGSLTWAAERGNEQVLAQLGGLANAEGWDRFLGVAAQVTAAGGVLGFGVVLSWMVGREFADGTVAGLFALPVSRSAVALAKLASYALWAVAVAAILVVLLAIGGVVLGLGRVDAEALDGLGRQLTLMVLSAGLAVPAAWAATLGRGLLPGIATTIGIIVVAQVLVIAGTGAWFPLAAPALWALEPDEVSSGQLALSTLVPLVVGWATLVAWRRLQLD
ncbi:ABC transporter permease [Jiangella ureilytica]|uniref:ABC transporter permease n=1 Tax=Jiangella ureilytica TaxID=2530374 RepID=A0A4R4RTB5_9ACTN|nr:ABC transporter permease [Jiangella ureilytica]TDC53287.1 ABC transporter permease [Jiangella ureilytica]